MSGGLVIELAVRALVQSTRVKEETLIILANLFVYPASSLLRLLSTFIPKFHRKIQYFLIENYLFLSFHPVSSQPYAEKVSDPRAEMHNSFVSNS